MKLTRTTAVLAAATLAAGTSAAGPALASTAHAAQHQAAKSQPAQQESAKPPGHRSLFQLLAKDGNKFDRNGRDFDIVDRIVREALKANPASDIRIVKQGRKPLTAFIPTDNAVRVFVADQTGKVEKSEKAVHDTLLTVVSPDLLATALLYHVVPGKTLTYQQLRKMNGARLPTAAMPFSLKVQVKKKAVTLVDNDPNDTNPRIVVRNLNRGNKQIGQGINRLLRLQDLP